MLTRLAHLAVRRRRLILVAAALLFAVAGAVGGGVAQHLSSGGFDDPSSESSRAEAFLADELGTGSPNIVLLVTADPGTTVDDPVVARSGQELTDALAAEPDVADVASYWSLGRPAPLRSADDASESSALVVARIEGDQDAVVTRAGEIRDELGGTIEGATVTTGGFAAVFNDVGHTVEEDLVRAELIALPITVILLLLIFRGLVAALLPLIVGALSVVGTFLVLRGLAEVTEVSIFALNLTTALGLGLAIDYSLFVISRYREELAAGFAPNAAVVRTVRTAGRTVAFSALTVAASLCALLVFPQAFLRSFAYAGVPVAALAGLFAVVVLPALLAVLGHRVDALSLRRREPRPVGEGIWHRIATTVMRRPVPVITVVVVGLVFLGSPFLHIDLGRPDDRVLPPSTESRQVNDTLRQDYGSQEAGALSVVLPDTGSEGEDAVVVAAYATDLSTLDGVERVDAATGVYLDGAEVPVDGALTERFVGEEATWLSVVPSVEPVSPAGEQLVEDIRAVEVPFDVEVGGQPAQLVDSKDSLFSRLPLALALIAVVTFILLFLMFGSVLVPVKALVLNLLSLTATFGAMVWIFQDGNLSGVLGFTATGTIDATTPILMFCIAFGLSMDYEVFLLSRIKEEHDRGRDNISAVAVGLERTGRIVTAAALLIAVVFTAFATSNVSFIKLFGVGLTLAVLMDAFVIRSTLVPAFMRLAGEANWWAPAWMRRIHDRIGISETVDLTDPDDPSSDEGPLAGPDGGPAPDADRHPAGVG